MNTAAPVQIIASGNPLCFAPEAGMAACCLDTAKILATEAAVPIEALESEGCNPIDGSGGLTKALSGRLHPAEIQRLPP
jgi:hypothetical protein